MKRLWVIAVVGIALLLGYVSVRQTTINRLDRDLQALQERLARQQELRQSIANQERHQPAAIDIASLVEALYTCARQADIDDHEVTTSQRKAPVQAGRIRRDTGPDTGAELKVSHLQVMLRSDYRSLAEYLRQVDGLGLPTQINRLEMTAEGSTIRMLLLIDLYSLKRSDHHVR